MQIEHERLGRRHLLRLAGQLDGTGAPQLEHACETCLADGGRHLVLEMSGLAYISSIGLSTILVVAKQLDLAAAEGSDAGETGDAGDAGGPAPGGSLTLVAMTEAVRDVFEMTGFISLFPVVDDIASLPPL